MQDHGHKRSPPKTKRTAVTNITTAVFRITHFVRQKCTTSKPRSFVLSKPQCRTKIPFPMKNHVRKKHQSRSFDSHLTQKVLAAFCPSLLGFPMTDFRQKDKTSMHTATGIVTDSHRVPFSPPKPVKSSLCSLGDTLCDLLNLSMTFCHTYVLYHKMYFYSIQKTNMFLYKRYF